MGILSVRKSPIMRWTRTWLALGDSYTVGEGVPLYDSYPYQTMRMLRRKGDDWSAPEIVARTGWTTDELASGIEAAQLMAKYDLVTLLIGVNNQYRGRGVEEYERQFSSLLQTAIARAGYEKGHVIVLSIPDWGVTPFAAERDVKKIASEIDAFNAVNRAVSQREGVGWLDVTASTRAAKGDGGRFAKDGLHPSGLEYAIWAEALAARVAAIR
jgi:lysophospholipase L1-like esterase